MSEAQSRDPVCGMTVNPATSPHHHVHEGQTYLFCCNRCREKFAADPAAYLAPQPAPPPAPAGTVFTCPMHPEIQASAPGPCPLCGMALEAAGLPSDAPSAELTDMKRRLVIAAAFTLPIFALEMAPHVGLPRPAAASWVQCVLATPVIIWAAAPFFARAATSVRTGALNMFTLIALGVGTAYLYSLAATFMPGLFPPSMGHHGALPVYYESAAVITVLVLLGQVLELTARARTGSAIRALLNLAPKTARRLTTSGTDEEIPLDAIRRNDRLRIRPGEAIPADGIVLDGTSTLDESMLTGEAMRVAKSAGAALSAGTINGTGTLTMRADRVGGETMLSRIVHLVADAQRSRAPIQRLADRVAAWFVPAVIAVAVLAFGAWLAFGPPPAFAFALLAAVSVVIIACPCALGLATPMSIMVGIGRGATEGVLISNAEALERLEKVDTLVLDKTGTLTAGKPQVVAILPAPGVDETHLLTLAASVEQGSEHPLAGAILAAAASRALALLPVTDFAATTGKGITGRVGGQLVAIGNDHLAANNQQAHADAHRARGDTVISISIDSAPAGLIAIADPIKPTTQSALATLRQAGLKIVMLTGDNRATAAAIAATLGITEIEAEILPDQKAAFIKRLQSAGRIVAMAGDGVNDAPALAAADVGIAMGTGTDVAIQSAGITLVKGDLAFIIRARALSRATMGNIRQNLVLAFAYNMLGVPIAAGVLYPAFGILLSPIVAAAAMSLSSVSVIANALRLRASRL